MKVGLVIQCIDTFEFKPPKDLLCFYVNGVKTSATVKDNGFYVLTKELPVSFSLTITSDTYITYEQNVLLPYDGILAINLIRKFPPFRRSAIWLEVKAQTRIVLGYGYYLLLEQCQQGANKIVIENPLRMCLEGREFILRDTTTQQEECITIGVAMDATLQVYHVKQLQHQYESSTSVLLPSFICNKKATVPIAEPIKMPAPIWLYGKDSEAKRIDIK